MSEASAPGTRPDSGRSLVAGWAPTLIFNIALPIGTYFVLTGPAHLRQIPALLISGIWPLLELIVTIWRQHRVDEFSTFALLLIVIGVIVTVFSGNARALFLKDWGIWGLFAIVILVSMALPRPLMFYFGRRFGTDGSKAQRDWWNGLWRYPAFRRVQRVINIVWGVALLAEAVVGTVLTLRLGSAAMVVVDNVLPYVVLVLLIVWTTFYGRPAQARAQRHHVGAEPPITASSASDHPT